MSSGSWALVVIGWFVLLGFVTWVLLAAMQTRNHQSPPSPHEILDRRLASGEISLDEYEELLEALESHEGRVPANH